MYDKFLRALRGVIKFLITNNSNSISLLFTEYRY
jgi:hypothetical protein